MTPAKAIDMHRRQIAKHGSEITIKNGAQQKTVRVRITGYKPDELGGGIQQGDRKIIVIAEDVPFEVKANQKVIVRGRALNIEVVDDSTRRIDDVLIAYELTARG